MSDPLAETTPLAEQSAALTEPPTKKRKLKPPLLTAPPNCYLPINTYDWQYDLSLSFDANYIDLACLIARNSQSLKGHMGAVIVRSPSEENPQGDIITLATNVPVYPVKEGKSMKQSAEIHAEAAAIAACARLGRPTAGCSIYITFPPCKECFQTLVYAGIKKVVFRRQVVVEGMWEVAKEWGMELVEMKDIEEDKRSAERCRERVKQWEDCQKERIDNLNTSI